MINVEPKPSRTEPEVLVVHFLRSCAGTVRNCLDPIQLISTQDGTIQGGESQGHEGAEPVVSRGRASAKGRVFRPETLPHRSGYHVWASSVTTGVMDGMRKMPNRQAIDIT